MKSYNIQNYIRYKEDLMRVNKNNFAEDFSSYSRDDLIAKFLPLVENIAKKFSTTTQASGVLDITDLIQYGSIGLILAVDKIDWDKITNSKDQEKTIKAFISNYVKGSIRRAIDINRGAIRIPEHKLIEIRKDNGQDHKMAALFFNSIFLSIDEQMDDDENENMLYQIPDRTEVYNIGMMNIFLTDLLKKHLNNTEFEVLRLSYGLDCDRHSANQIADYLGIEGASAYVRISELKKQAITKLIAAVDTSQILDFL